MVPCDTVNVVASDPVKAGAASRRRLAGDDRRFAVTTKRFVFATASESAAATSTTKRPSLAGTAETFVAERLTGWPATTTLSSSRVTCTARPRASTSSEAASGGTTVYVALTIASPQPFASLSEKVASMTTASPTLAVASDASNVTKGASFAASRAVSYTHLTLPTKRIV